MNNQPIIVMCPVHAFRTVDLKKMGRGVATLQLGVWDWWISCMAVCILFPKFWGYYSTPKHLLIYSLGFGTFSHWKQKPKLSGGCHDQKVGAS